MSQKDLQFIERALKRPWMFWVYFWKWPRIVRQACAEYDLLAKERDAAKAAHERSERANKIVRDWIHVTHRLSTTPEAIRAIFAAGKRLSILLVFFVVTNAFGQAPPYLRNQWTTNANPLALKVISTNGVHAATNVWELDFTNTATVTVSAVSNANKVMVSFTGSGGGGDTIWTNYGANAYTLIVMPGTIQVFTNGVISSFPTGTNKQAHLTNGGFAGFYSIDSVAVGTPITDSGVAVARFNSDDGLGNTNCDVAANRAGIAAGTMEGSNDGHILGLDGSVSSGFFYWSTNVDIFSDSGSIAGGYMELTTGARIRAVDGSVAGGQIVSSHGGLTSAQFVNILASDGALGFGNINISSNISVISDEGSIVASEINSSTNSSIFGQDGSIIAAFVQGANTTNHAFIGSIAAGISRTGERLFASGALDGVGALSVGRDIASTNNWTFGIHYTNTVPLSLAVGANGTTQFRAASNSVVIRTETAPTVGQILTATDTDGTVGWSNAPAGGGGVTNAIGSIYTNNVLAGGPGLTELEFTNTASVTWVATTNAGRVTMSASAAAGAQTPWASDIDAASFSLANFGSTLSFTNGSKIGATAINTLTLTNAHLRFSPDNTFDIGAFGANRPANVYISQGYNGDSITCGNYVFAGASGRIGFQGRSELRSPADGQFTFLNTGLTGFDRVNFGGTTATFPALKRDAAGLAIVGADGVGTSTNNLAIAGSLSVTNFIRAIGPITNDTLTASTVLAADATKEIVSIANAAGILTNDGAGIVGWKPLSDFGGGSSSLTNALLHAGPTNGSVGALVLTAGNGVTLTTSGTNRIAAIDTNVVAEISDLVWTNFTWTDLDGSTVYGVGLSNQLALAARIAVNYITNINGEPSSILAFGFRAGNTAGDTNSSASVHSFGDYAGYDQVAVRSYSVVNVGVDAGSQQILTNTIGIFNGGSSAGSSQRMTNTFVVSNFGGNSGSGQKLSSVTGLFNLGNSAGRNQIISNAAAIFNQGNQAGFGQIITGLDSGANVAATIWNVGRDAGNAQIIAQKSVDLINFGTSAGASRRLTNCVNIYAIGSSSGTNLVLTGVSNVMIFGNILASVPNAEEFWFGNSNNIYRFPGTGVITNVSHSPLAAGQIAITNGNMTSDRKLKSLQAGSNVTLTDEGTNIIIAASGTGGGIASIFTNNVLAGGPGLTELGFTNSPSVTWTATTNAGRVTMSATSAAGAQTPWASDIDAASFSLNNFGSTLSFTNGSKIGATAVNTLSLTNAHLRFSPDNTYSIGASGATRPLSIFIGTSGVNSEGNVRIASAQSFVFADRSILSSTADGDLLLRDSTVASFGKVQFGGTTAPFPALKRNGAGFEIVGAGGVGTESNNLAIAGSLSVTNFIRAIGPITNDTLTASTVLAADATKEIVSIANGAGVLTNDGAGVVGYMSLGSFGGGGDGAGIKVWTNEVAVGVGTNLDLIAGDNITILATNLTGAGGTNAISIGLTTSINTRQVGSAVLTNLAATRAVTNMTVTTITNVGVSLYTVPSGCTYIWVECIGGGGGGGGVDGAASQSAAGGGGGSGAYCSTNIGSPAASYIVTVGTNGLGGAGTGGNAGTIGGTTLFTNILTALGGSGGAGKSSAAAVSITLGGAGALETATGRVYTGGNPGHNGICVSGTLAISGGGAGSHFGGGGAPQTAAVGANATGKGAGGSGAAVITNADRNGGNGSPGIIVIREFYQ